MAHRVRPEHSGPPELYYNEDEASKYASNSHIVSIQTEMAERALELLALGEENSGLILDIGCGTGISSEVITGLGHHFIGMDVSLPMLQIGVEGDEGDLAGDFVLRDMGTGVPFRPGSFDGAISISAIQWLCHANATRENPKKRLYHFFQTLYGCLGRGTRAVFQFYPENDAQVELIMGQATRAGFNGGLVVDFPHSSKAKKLYLVLMTGGVQQLPKALTGEEKYECKTSVDNVERRDVRHNSKYTGRKRKTKF